VNNASLDEARALAQSLKDATQDASGALVELAAASAASSISALEGRVGVLEAVPPTDLSSVEGRLTAAEAAIVDKANAADVNAALDLKASAMSVYSLGVRLDAEEAATTATGSRLDAVESALPTKVAQADYDVAVASLEASVASAQAAADSASTAAAAAQTTANAAEVKGLMSKLEVEDNSTAGVSPAYWAETQGGVLAGIMDTHKIANYLFDAPASELVIPVGTPVAGAVRRLRNAHTTATLPIALDGNSYEIMAGETMVWQHNGTAWRLI